jgi:hypothetical protein
MHVNSGHSSVSFTLNVYAHVLPSAKQSAAQKLEKLLFAGSSILIGTHCIYRIAVNIYLAQPWQF